MAGKGDVVLNVMKKAGKPVKTDDVAEATGMDKAEVSKIIAALKKQSKVTSPKHVSTNGEMRRKADYNERSLALA